MLFDFLKVIWIGKIQYEPNSIMGIHKHDFFQFFYILDGTGHLITNYGTYPLTAGKLFFCPPDYYHNLITSDTNVIKTIEVKFDLQDKDAFSKFSNIRGLINMESNDIRKTLENLIIEALNENEFSRDIINLEIAVILIKILKKLNSIKHEDNTLMETEAMSYHSYVGIFSKIFEYINKNISSQIRLEDLSRLVGLDPAYLCRIFKKEFGITPIYYIKEVKIVKARELLINTENNITEISEMLGFYSVHYLSKCFKEKYDVSPLEYRKKVRDNIRIVLDKDYSNYL